MAKILKKINEEVKQVNITQLIVNNGFENGSVNIDGFTNGANALIKGLSGSETKDRNAVGNIQINSSQSGEVTIFMEVRLWDELEETNEEYEARLLSEKTKLEKDLQILSHKQTRIDEIIQELEAI